MLGKRRPELVERRLVAIDRPVDELRGGLIVVEVGEEVSPGRLGIERGHGLGKGRRFGDVRMVDRELIDLDAQLRAEKHLAIGADRVRQRFAGLHQPVPVDCGKVVGGTGVVGEADHEVVDAPHVPLDRVARTATKVADCRRRPRGRLDARWAGRRRTDHPGGVLLTAVR